MTGLFVGLIFLCAVGSGLMAGVFFAFSTFVMAGLARLAPADGIAAMNAINVRAITPIFMALLFGTGFLCTVAMVATLIDWGEAGSVDALFGGAFYVLGAIVVTMMRNVPLNNALARIAPADPAAPAIWADYLRDWTRWNHVRSITCTLASALFIAAG